MNRKSPQDVVEQKKVRSSRFGTPVTSAFVALLPFEIGALGVLMIPFLEIWSAAHQFIRHLVGN